MYLYECIYTKFKVTKIQVTCKDVYAFQNMVLVIILIERNESLPGLVHFLYCICEIIKSHK